MVKEDYIKGLLLYIWGFFCLVDGDLGFCLWKVDEIILGMERIGVVSDVNVNV